MTYSEFLSKKNSLPYYSDSILQSIIESAGKLICESYWQSLGELAEKELARRKSSIPEKPKKSFLPNFLKSKK